VGFDALNELLAFVGVAVVVIVTPGQDTALTVRNTLAAGRAAGMRTAAGVVSGQAVWALAASAGVAALLVASEPAFLALKLAGAAYLIFLGGQALAAAVRGGAGDRREPARPSRGHELRQGMLSDLGNPKMAVFFSSLLPQFGESFPELLALGLLFCALTLAWLAAYAAALARAGDVLRRPRVRRAVDAITGTALVALGVRLAAADR
jgi:threonine/homoserine/homoserine lactone efflux protein